MREKVVWKQSMRYQRLNKNLLFCGGYARLFLYFIYKIHYKGLIWVWSGQLNLYYSLQSILPIVTSRIKVLRVFVNQLLICYCLSLRWPKTFFRGAFGDFHPGHWNSTYVNFVAEIGSGLGTLYPSLIYLLRKVPGGEGWPPWILEYIWHILDRKQINAIFMNFMILILKRLTSQIHFEYGLIASCIFKLQLRKNIYTIFMWLV